MAVLVGYKNLLNYTIDCLEYCFCFIYKVVVWSIIRDEGVDRTCGCGGWKVVVVEGWMHWYDHTYHAAMARNQSKKKAVDLIHFPN